MQLTKKKAFLTEDFNDLMVPTIGLEPTTYALRVRCTTNCATSASVSYFSRCRVYFQCLKQIY